MIDERTADLVMDPLGAKKLTDDEGPYWLLTIGDVVAKVIPFSRNSKGMLKVGIAVSVTQPELSRIANLIMKRRSDNWFQFEYFQADDMIPVNGNVKSCLNGVVRREVERLKGVTIDDLVAKFESPYPSVESKLQEQVRHLVALAYSGNVRQLDEYLNWFKQGKRYNFRDAINQGTIEAALAIAHEQISR